ncbi:MAG: NHL repeat-containing protein [bacterium]|nr:MAG: NHL repeat-containing protein [bacterium]
MRIRLGIRQLTILLGLAIILLLLTVTSKSGTVIVTPPWNHCLGLNKVTQFHLDIFSGYREKFDDPQGLFCTKLHCEDDPQTPKDDDELTVFGLNSGRHTLIYNKSLTSIGIVGGLGRGLLEFKRPQAVTGNSDGDVFVADTGNDRLVHLRYEDDELLPIDEFTGPDDKPFNRPSGIALGGDLLYVADTRNDRIALVTMDGTITAEYRPEYRGARLYRPYRVAVVTSNDEWFYYRDYFIAVVDSMGGRLWKITPDGTVRNLIRYRAIGDTGGFNHVAIDYYGNVYVTDTHNGTIHKFNRHFQYIMAIGEKGTGEGQFDEPRGISIYRRFGQIFVSERAGAQYHWIGTDLLRLSAERLMFDTEKKTCRIDLSFLLAEHSFVTLYLENEDGERIVDIVSDYMLPSGFFKRRIEIACNKVQLLAKCKVRLVAIAKPTYSSKAYLSVTRRTHFIDPCPTPLTSSLAK